MPWLFIQPLFYGTFGSPQVLGGLRCCLGASAAPQPGLGGLAVDGRPSGNGGSAAWACPVIDVLYCIVINKYGKSFTIVL